MSVFRSFTLFILLAIGLSSCSIFGIHYSIHNPKRAGSYRHADTKAMHLLGTLTKYRSCYDAKYYALSLTIDPAKRSIDGVVVMKAEATEDFDTLQVDLYKNLKMEKIYFSPSDPKGVTFTRKEGAVFVAMPHRIHKGDVFILQMLYSGTPVTAHKPPWDGGLVWKKDKWGRDWDGVACETEGASLWWPCKDHTSDEPDSVFMSVSVPKGLTCVCNGRLVTDPEHYIHRDPEKKKDNYETFSWFVSNPINLYDVTFYIGSFRLLHDEYHSSVTGQTLDLNHYVLDSNYDKALHHFQQLKDYLAFYEKTYGPYPWYKDGFKLVESPYEGMEHQSAIAYGNGYKNSYRQPFDYIILHETAHEWWGNSITAADLADVWIQEGMATYTEALYVEATQGREAAINYLLFYRITIINRRPVVGPTGRRWFWYKDGDVYVKGAWMMHTLRTVLNNDPLFFDILKSFRETYNGKTVTSQDFISWVNKKTGEDYTWFFKQYLYNRFTPILEFCTEENKVYYRWTKCNADFKMPVEIILNENKKMKITPTTKRQVLELSIPVSSLQLSDGDELFGSRENKKLSRMKPSF